MQTRTQLIIKGDETLFSEVLALVGGWDHVLVDKPDERAARLGRQGLAIKRGDPSADPTELFGIWKDREDVTVDTLRDKAWSYRRR